MVRHCVSGLCLALILSGCGLQAERARLAAEDAVKPLPVDGYYQPGPVGIPGAKAQGLGPEIAAGSSTDTPEAEGSTTLDPVQKTLDSFSLRAEDLSEGSLVEPIAGGLEVEDQVTMDLCGQPFPSEAKRESRRQVASYSADGEPQGLSSEAVLYMTPDAAAQAMSELVQARKRCPETPVDIDGKQTTITFHPAPGPSDTPLMKGDDLAVVHLTEKSSEGAVTVLAIYQRRGRALVGFYVNESGDKPLSQEVLDGAFGFAGELADRLRALPKDVAEGAPTA